MVEIPENDFNLLLNSFNEGVCHLNAQGEILHYNKTAQVHWDITRQRSHKLTSRSAVLRALAGEHIYHELVHGDDDQSLLVNTLPLHAGSEATSGVIVVSFDVSEHVMLEQQAQSALNVLLEATLDSHEVKTIDEGLRRIAALIPQLESVDNSIAFRLDETTGKIIPLALFGESQQSYEEWHAELSAMEFSTEVAIHSSSPAYLQALRIERPIMVDFTANSRHSKPDKLRAAIYAPVLIDGHVVGLIGAERHRPPGNTGTYFPQWSVDLLTALARLASMSFEKTALLASVERLEKETVDLHTLLNQKEEFLMLAAHELKNPLTAILGQAQVLRLRINRSLHASADSSQQTHDLVRALESIEHQTRRISHMINTLLEVSRADLDRLELELREIDLLHLIRRSLKEYLPLAPKHELHLIVNDEQVPIFADEAPTVAPIILQADEHRLEQVITNLISNAIKYSPDGGPITLSLRQTDTFVAFSTADKGIGVPLKEQDHLAERFYRAENAQSTTSKGLGLGLYLVNELVKKHGGHLSVESEGIPGKGSIFTITFPFQKA